MTALSLCLTLALVMEMAPVRADEAFDQKVAANGTNFVKLSDDEKTDFLLFGSNAKYADGMQGRWKMLTKAQVQSVKSNTSATAVFGDFGYSLWSSNQNFSTYKDGELLFDKGISGIDLKLLAMGYGIKWNNTNTKTQLTAIDKTGAKARTTSHAFENSHYYFSDIDDEGEEVEPLLKVKDGTFSLRVGQEKATQTTSHQWKNDIKALQIDTVTTATQKPDVVFDVVDGNTQEEYVLSDIVDAGQYRAEFAYYNSSNEPVTAEVEGVKLSDVLAKRKISLASGDTIYAVDDRGTKTQLKSSPSNYLLAYQGATQTEGSAPEELTSNSEFCLFGPGSTEAAVRMNNIYSVTITRKVTPAPAPAQVTKPKSTKILKLTKKKRTITVKWKKISGVNGYQISMATKKKGKYKVIKTVTKAGTVKYTKKKLKKGKKYFFRVRTYKTVNGKKYFSSWSAIKYKKL